jgi:hypothetical protein
MRGFAIASLTLAASACGRSNADLEDRIKRLEGAVAALQVAHSASAAMPAGASVDPKVACARAKVTCVDAWEKALPGAHEARKAAGAKWCDGPPGCTWIRPELVTTVEAAKGSCRLGATKNREATKRVADDQKNPELAVAKAASATLFEACKDIEP